MDSTTPITLEQVTTASPCPMSWADMRGDQHSRFCGQCGLNVYNLSAMTRAEAEQLVNSHEGRLCAMYYRRADGTILTSDCPVGRGIARRRRARLATAAAALVSLAFGAVASLTTTTSRTKLSRLEPFSTVRGWFITPPPPPPTRCMLGTVAYIPPTPSTPSQDNANEDPTCEMNPPTPEH